MHFSSFLLVCRKARALAQLAHSPSLLIGFSCGASSRRWCIQKRILLSYKDRLFKAVWWCSQQLSESRTELL